MTDILVEATRAPLSNLRPESGPDVLPRAYPLVERGNAVELWTYYRVTIGGAGRIFLLRLTGESGGRIFGLEVDDRGKSLRRDDGTLRFHVLDRSTVIEMLPLTLFGGRLVTAEKTRREDLKPEKAESGLDSAPPPD